MLESLFTFFFKYRPGVFEDGHFAFAATQPWMLVTCALAVVLATAATYLRQRPRIGPRRVAVLAVLRALAVALILFALLRPVLSVSSAVPGENFLAVVIDDSRSMQLADDGETTRGTQAVEAFLADSSPLLARLEERFTLRYYRFSDVIARMDPASQAPAFQGTRTHLAAALDHVRQDLSGIPLAGTVLVTDGADNSDTASREQALAEPLLQLKSRGIPIYTVGLGEERFRRDIELSRLDGPDRVLEGSAFAVDVTVAQQGYDGRTVVLTVEEDGAIVETRDVVLPEGQSETTVPVHLEAEEHGHHDYRFYVEPEADEHISRNNARDLLLTVRNRREKILYVEGEPRWEVKFLRQALADDDNVHVVVLQRSAKNKFLRLGVDDALELITGFPETREELFAYRGLILGTIEASYFTANQLRIIEEFVSQRGGGLMLLGGRESFAEGGYRGTPLEDVFPVVPETPVPDFLAEVRVAPTPAGLAHTALRLDAAEESSEERWATLPALSTRNPLYRVKPGASVLLTGTPVNGAADAGTPDSVADDLVVLASQRYGRGRVMAFTVQDFWMWQMHADIPIEDMTHERLWRQLLRWLMSSVPQQVEVKTDGNQVAPGELVSLRAEVNDAAYLGLNGARVEATVTDPTGQEQTIPFEWTVEQDGEYRATFAPDQLGPYEVSVRAEHAGETVGSDETRVVASDMPTEFFGAEMNAPLLSRIAEETGGRFYTARSMGSLPDDARFTRSGKTVVETLDLWDMPAVFLLLLGLICAEWALRRRRGLI